MKKTIAIIILLFFILLFPASASIGSKGLIIEGGKKTIILEKGEKEYLNVQDGWSKLPLLKDISYYSDNRIIATVGLHSGILRANAIGTATITAINKNGDAGQIRVQVVAPDRKSLLPALLLLPIGAFLLYIIIKR